MASILPPRAKTEFRLLCAECRKRDGSKDDGLVCLFEEYTTPPDPTLVDVYFELRDQNGVIERRERDKEWAPYTGKVVLCVGCLEASKGQGYVVFDPRTREFVGA